MKTHVLTKDAVAISAHAGVAVGVLSILVVSGAALAAGRGLPACTRSLNSCSADLTTAEDSLSMCSADLTVCEDALTASQACGNGVIDPDEECDQSELAFNTCEGLGFGAGVLKCGAGCLFDTSDCSASRFVNNGDGTVSDLKTGLMWETKTFGECRLSPFGFPIRCKTDEDCFNNGGGGLCTCGPNGCDRFVGRTYTWNDSPIICENGAEPNGTVFTDFLTTLNRSPYGCRSLTGYTYETHVTQFAGHCDWRLPTITELRTIVDNTRGYCGGAPSGPCIDPIFGPTIAQEYWSSTRGAYLTSDVFGEFGAWTIHFLDGVSLAECKNATRYARAVRSTSGP